MNKTHKFHSYQQLLTRYILRNLLWLYPLLFTFILIWQKYILFFKKTNIFLIYFNLFSSPLSYTHVTNYHHIIQHVQTKHIIPIL